MRRNYTVDQGALDIKYLLGDKRWHPLENAITNDDQVTEENSHRIPQHNSSGKMHETYKKFRLGLIPKDKTPKFIFNASDLGTWLGLWLPQACRQFKCTKYATIDKVYEFLQLVTGAKEEKKGFQFEWGQKHEANAMKCFLDNSPYPIELFEVGARRYHIGDDIYTSAAPDAYFTHRSAVNTVMHNVRGCVEAKCLTPVMEIGGKRIVLPPRVPVNRPQHYYGPQMFAQMRAFQTYYQYFLSWSLENGEAFFLMERRDSIIEDIAYLQRFLFIEWILPMTSENPPVIEPSLEFNPFAKIADRYTKFLKDLDDVLDNAIIKKWHTKKQQ